MTQQLADSILGQLRVYDAQHLSDMLDAVANALARVAPLYVRDGNGKEPRQLMEGELEGALVNHSATVLIQKDGRTYSAVTVKRDDLRQAIAILKAVGIPELAGLPRLPSRPSPRRPTASPCSSRLSCRRSSSAPPTSWFRSPAPRRMAACRTWRCAS